MLVGTCIAAGQDSVVLNANLVRNVMGLQDLMVCCWSAGAHTDWGMLTVLATDAQPGLQISHQGTWIDVEPRPGHFVINIGDLLDRYDMHSKT